ncbi:mmuM Homocysteine S-methyltransferase [Candida maltosa Xu316]|uniref:Hcy-binding domain-containing protein n=1 Tax=Candida maltosa (strain Xu316) TaxID=1245528 RepID=M3ITC4_CANMX|nr:hypothetical protein G210_5331 [Candida maltosa Xu316]
MGHYKEIFQQKRLVLDGAMGTELERVLPPNSAALPSSSPLWSGQVLVSNPELVEEVHLDYINAGADMVITNTYQTSYASLNKYAGYDMEKSTKLWELAVEAAKNAVKKSGRNDVIVAGSIGPYATVLANGSEYTGDYQGATYDDIVKYHTPLFEFYDKSDADIICIETIPNFTELQVVIDMMKKYQSKEYFIAINPQSTSALSDGTSLTKVAELFATIEDDSRFLGVGINCTNYDYIEKIIEYFGNFSLLIYPNLGFVYDTAVHKFVPKSIHESSWENAVKAWLKHDNVRAVGGCCSTTPVEIKTVAKAISECNK